jgi:hypothetical protein
LEAAEPAEFIEVEEEEEVVEARRGFWAENVSLIKEALREDFAALQTGQQGIGERLDKHDEHFVSIDNELKTLIDAVKTLTDEVKNLSRSK